MKISININCNILLFIVFCTVLIPSAYASGDIPFPYAQQYPGHDAECLKCYDQLAASASVLAPAVQQNIVPDENSAASTTSAAALPPGPERSYLTKAWNLDNLTNWDQSQLGRLLPYRQNYLLVNKTSNLNRQPYSPAIGHNTPVPEVLGAAEIKFQLSFKADIGSQSNIDFLGIKTLRLWGAYTQQSYWQAFNIKNQSPFRETVYEPELIATLGTGYESGLKLINLGFVHQSNGQTLQKERSWNRIYMLGGWEWNDTTSVLLRGWRRVQNRSLIDDNPDISDYLGRGDLVIRWEPVDKSQSIAMLLRNNLHRTDNRGYTQIDWATPAKFGNAARMHVQLTSGFGESLIDYNHRQNTIGLGFSFREW